MMLLFLMKAISMPKKAPPSLFISYSQKDKALIQPIVEILRISGAPVFLDTDSIPKGKPWRATIVTAIQDCMNILVFWCAHSGKSKEVKKEYTEAMKQGKNIVPVMLDNTKMPRKLSALQGISLQGMLSGHGTSSEGYSAPSWRPGYEEEAWSPDMDDGAGGYALETNKVEATKEDEQESLRITGNYLKWKLYDRLTI